MSRLPIGYLKLQYIESTGTQWIDTLITAKTNTKIEIRVLVKSINDDYIVGARRDSGDTRFYLLHSNNSKGWAVTKDRWDGGSFVRSSSQTNRWYDIKTECLSAGCTLQVDDGSVISSSVSSSPNYGLNIYAFGCNNRGTASPSPSGTSIAYLKIEQDNVLVRDFVPCKRLSDGAIGMYDLVSQSFFGNAGTGEFIAGPPVIEPTWGSGVSQVSRKLLMRRDHLVADANAMYFGKSVQNGTPSIRNRVDIVDSVLKKVGDHLYPYVGTLPVPLRAVRLGKSVPSAFEAVGGIYFDGTDYWCADTYEPSKGRYIQRIREVVMTGTAPYNVNYYYNQLTKTFLVTNYFSALTSSANDLSAASYGPLCNYAATDIGTIFYGDYEHIGNFGNHGITFCVRYPYDYWGIARDEKTGDELIALVNALLKERYEAGVPYILRYVLRNPIVSNL